MVSDPALELNDAAVCVQQGTTTHLVARFELPASMEELVIEPSGRVKPTTWTYDDLGRALASKVADNAAWRAERPGQVTIPRAELVGAIRKILDARA